MSKCEECSGVGWVGSKEHCSPCTACNGRGVDEEKEHNNNCTCCNDKKCNGSIGTYRG